MANGEARDDRRDDAVALAAAGTGRGNGRGTGRTTIGRGRGRGRGRSSRGRCQQGSHNIFVGEDARETFDTSIGTSAALKQVEGLGPG